MTQRVTSLGSHPGRVHISRRQHDGSYDVVSQGDHVASIEPVYRDQARTRVASWLIVESPILPSHPARQDEFRTLARARYSAETTSWPVPRYRVSWGSHSYLPDTNECVSGFDSAVQFVADTFTLGRRRITRLRRDGYLALDPRRDGAEYAEIAECECDTCRLTPALACPDCGRDFDSDSD